MKENLGNPIQLFFQVISGDNVTFFSSKSMSEENLYIRDSSMMSLSESISQMSRDTITSAKLQKGANKNI